MTDWSSPEKAIEKIKSLVRAIPDFPIPGINFRYCMLFLFNDFAHSVRCNDHVITILSKIKESSLKSRTHSS